VEPDRTDGNVASRLVEAGKLIFTHSGAFRRLVANRSCPYRKFDGTEEASVVGKRQRVILGPYAAMLFVDIHLVRVP
jgi:hypothetical protein